MYGIECLDMKGRLTTIPGTMPIVRRKPVEPSCLKPWRGDRELDPIGEYDPALEGPPLAKAPIIEQHQPSWWTSLCGEYPHAATMAGVKRYFNIAREDGRRALETLPRSQEGPSRYDLQAAYNHLVDKGSIHG